MPTSALGGGKAQDSTCQLGGDLRKTVGPGESAVATGDFGRKRFSLAAVSCVSFLRASPPRPQGHATGPLPVPFPSTPVLLDLLSERISDRNQASQTAARGTIWYKNRDLERQSDFFSTMESAGLCSRQLSDSLQVWRSRGGGHGRSRLEKPGA
ncbi:uncharacterized protein LOC110598144 isoform X2 [Ictidomys tridecemlineatus]